VRIGEQRAPSGEPVEMGRLRLGMAAQAAHPVVLVVDGDEQDIGSRGGVCLGAEDAAAARGQHQQAE